MFSLLFWHNQLFKKYVDPKCLHNFTFCVICLVKQYRGEWFLMQDKWQIWYNHTLQWLVLILWTLMPCNHSVLQTMTCRYFFGKWEIIMMHHGDSSALRHLPALYNNTNYCIQVHVYLFVRVHIHLFIGLTVMHILNLVFRHHVNYAGSFKTLSNKSKVTTNSE